MILSTKKLNILVMEAYDDGSHRDFLDGLIQNSNHNYVRLSLPGCKWKLRMRASAIYFCRELENIWPESSAFEISGTDLIFTSDMTSVTDLKGLLPKQIADKKIICYFHENQLTYPLSEHDRIDYQFGYTNITSALAADAVWFNSEYNRTSFLDAADKLFGNNPDALPKGVCQDIRANSIIMPIGISNDFYSESKQHKNDPPIILWNHRWEYDKNPDDYFAALFKLSDMGINFKVIIAGQSFRNSPPIFETAKERLKDKIIHFGYAEDRSHYLSLLRQSDIVISTASHEFFGISVVEAMASGCYPLLPNRLNYPYLIPEHLHGKHLFKSNDELLDKLKIIIREKTFDTIEIQNHTENYNWQKIFNKYDTAFASVFAN